MASYLDQIQLSGITRIRDLMFTLQDPFRLDQGDVSFDAPETVKAAMTRAVAENKTHYVQTTGITRLRELITALRARCTNRVPGAGISTRSRERSPGRRKPSTSTPLTTRLAAS